MENIRKILIISIFVTPINWAINFHKLLRCIYNYVISGNFKNECINLKILQRNCQFRKRIWRNELDLNAIWSTSFSFYFPLYYLRLLYFSCSFCSFSSFSFCLSSSILLLLKIELPRLFGSASARSYRIGVVGNNWLLGWLVGNAVFSEMARRIFLIFCLKLGDYKGRKVTELDFWKKFLIWRYSRKRLAPNQTLWYFSQKRLPRFFWFLAWS